MQAFRSASSVGEQPFVSVVTPVYNGESYLAECIESVLSQTHSRFEYIIANNCSTDGSLEIARSYAKKDGRVRIRENETHLGQVDNINQALRDISPESRYCKVVFADDWLYPECIERMVMMGEMHPSVGIVSSYYALGTTVMNVGLPPVAGAYRGSDICVRTLLTGDFFFGTPSVILWRSDIVRSRHHFYQRNLLNEDTEACYEFLTKWDFGFIPQVLSCVRLGNVSITTSNADYGPTHVDYLITMKKYGPVYLSADVYARRAAEVEKSYMMFLGKSLIKGRGKSFWDYQKKGLNTIGFRLTAGKLMKYSALAGLDMLLNPKSTIQGLLARGRNGSQTGMDVHGRPQSGPRMMQEVRGMDISVIICTRDRPESIAMALSSLEASIASDSLQWEVLVVDSSSTDETASACRPFISRSPERYRYIYEGRQGKSVALNAGIRFARGEILAFTDDDCVVDRHWLDATAKEFQSDPDLAFLGGRVELYDNRDKPMTIITDQEKVALSSFDMLFRPTIIGCNMAFKREVLRHIGYFDVSLGGASRSGTASTEDIDIVYRAYRKGFKVVYFPSIVVYHNHGRRTDKEVDTLLYKYFLGRGAFLQKHALSDRQVARRLFWDFYRAFDRIRKGESVKSEVSFLRALVTGAFLRLRYILWPY
jgi:glycosyltransferase involved in cell wall biosynthesis